MDGLGSAWLTGLGDPAVDREPLTARELREQLPETIPEQLLAVQPHKRAIGVIDVLEAKVNDLTRGITNR